MYMSQDHSSTSPIQDGPESMHAAVVVGTNVGTAVGETVGMAGLYGR